jgi:peptidoglycan/LPS O-acetylase OafA/YrhL
MISPEPSSPEPQVPEPAHPRLLSARRTAYLPTLDGWRAIAILLVLGHHATSSFREAFGPHAAPIVRFFHDHGRTGVWIFFGLSGFLICTRLLEEYQSESRIRLAPFYIRRAHRILPPLLVYLIVVAILGATGIIVLPLRDWLAALLFAANYVHLQSWYITHFWTLAIEEHFYLFFPLLLAITSARRALWITLALALAVGGWRWIDVSMKLVAPPLRLPWERTDSACDGLLWGCVMALVYHIPRAREFLVVRLNAIVFPVLLATFIALDFTRSSPHPIQLIGFNAQLVLIPLLLVATVTHPDTLAARFLELAPLRWIGRLSYSLYLWQQLFLVWAGANAPLLGPLQKWPVNLACALACAALSYYLVERPLIREGYRASARYAGNQPHSTPAIPVSIG